ncbi:MAG: 4a-hydroxytetrahydrobiopterin dehydratase [Balneolaceae bacterium]
MEVLSKDQIQEELKSLDGWIYKDDLITKDFRFKDFKSALSFIVRIGFEAEDQVHHPQLFNVYNNVTVSLNTHDAGNKVTNKDIKLAKTIDSIYDTF